MEKKNLKQVRREQKKEKRISRVARQIQKELGLMMSEDARRMPGVIVSVSEVRMSPYMSMADVRDDGSFDGFYLQPIAAALYKYSCLLRWKGL